MTADDFTNLVEAEIERRKPPTISMDGIENLQLRPPMIVELQQMCDCPYGEPDDGNRCVECGRKYREVGRG